MQQGTLSLRIVKLLEEGKKRDEIISVLLAEGHDEPFAHEIVGEAVKIRSAKDRAKALTLILTGGLICVVSCVITLISSFSHSAFPIVLYGMTTVGIVIVFVGFSKVF
jgi:hypothetical protein